MSRKIEFTENGMRVTENGKVLKEGPIHEVQDWLDHQENIARQNPEKTNKK
jgi:hypothetical protein